MKNTNIIIVALIAIIGFSIVSCQKKETSSVVVPQETVETVISDNISITPEPVQVESSEVASIPAEPAQAAAQTAAAPAATPAPAAQESTADMRHLMTGTWTKNDDSWEESITFSIEDGDYWITFRHADQYMMYQEVNVKVDSYNGATARATHFYYLSDDVFQRYNFSLRISGDSLSASGLTGEFVKDARFWNFNGSYSRQ
jgi:type IV secretory pathway VirB10-like protein